MPFLSSTGVSLQSRSARIWLGASRPPGSRQHSRYSRSSSGPCSSCVTDRLFSSLAAPATVPRSYPVATGSIHGLAMRGCPAGGRSAAGSHDRRFALGRMGAAVSARATSKRPLGAAGCGATPRGLGPHRHELWRRTRPAGLADPPQEPGHEASVGSVADAEDGTSPGGGRGLAREHPRGRSRASP